MRPLWRDVIFFSLSVPSDSLILRHNGAAPEQSVCCVWKHRRASQAPLTRRWGSSCWNGGIIRKKRKEKERKESLITPATGLHEVTHFDRSDVTWQPRNPCSVCQEKAACMIHEIWFSGGFCHGFYKVCVFFYPPPFQLPTRSCVSPVRWWGRWRWWWWCPLGSQRQTWCGDNKVPLGRGCGEVTEPEDTRLLIRRRQVCRSSGKSWDVDGKRGRSCEVWCEPLSSTSVWVRSSPIRPAVFAVFLFFFPSANRKVMPVWCCWTDQLKSSTSSSRRKNKSVTGCFRKTPIIPSPTESASLLEEKQIMIYFFFKQRDFEQLVPFDPSTAIVQSH